MSVPKIMLLSHVPPGPSGVGPLYLRALCQMYPRDRICCCCLTRDVNTTGQPDPDWLPLERVEASGDFGLMGKPGGIVRRAQRVLHQRAIEWVRVPQMIDQVVRMGRSWRPDLIWSPLHSPATIRAARPVAEALGTPLLTTVWDPPEYVLRDYRQDRLTVRRLLRQFDDTLRASRRCATASYPMKECYEERYGTSCVPMTYGQRRGVEVSPRPARRLADRITIGFVGHLYAEDAWDSFLAALAARDWRIGGREVVLKVMGSGFRQTGFRPLHVELFGWRTLAEASRMLGELDVAYLPYWFDPAYREVVQLSFPSKMATYVAARTPVFYHGPSESSISRFLQQYPVGVGCHAQEPQAIAEDLERMLCSPDVLERALTACDDAYRDELSAEVFRRRFAEFLDVGYEELLSTDAENGAG